MKAGVVGSGSHRPWWSDCGLIAANMLPDGHALLWRSSLVLASGRSNDSSVHFPTHTRHSQASLIQEQVGTGAVVIVG